MSSRRCSKAPPLFLPLLVGDGVKLRIDLHQPERKFAVVGQAGEFHVATLDGHVFEVGLEASFRVHEPAAPDQVSLQDSDNWPGRIVNNLFH